MPEYKAPGVYVTEVPAPPHPAVVGVSTSTLGLAGITERGPLEPRLIRSASEFQSLFGGFPRTTINGGPGAIAYLPHAVRGFFHNGGQRCVIARVGGDGSAKRHLAALDALAEHRGIELLAVPDEVHFTAEELAEPVMRQAERLRRFAILATRSPFAEADLLAGRESAHAALYHPWLLTPDPEGGKPLLVPPHGHVAGAYARIDVERGIHEAPADEGLNGVVDVHPNLTADQRRSLHERHVNCIANFPGRGIRVWGARTTSHDPEWKYVSVRRTMSFLETSVEEGLRWVAFEPNDGATWRRVREVVSAFLTQVHRTGMLVGHTSESAFFVRCDRTTMTEADLAAGLLRLTVGVAILQPAEFVLIHMQQLTAGGRAIVP